MTKPKLNVFIIEDNPIDLTLLERILNGSDFHIAGSSHSATNAIEKINETKPDLFIVDINLPGNRDGIDLVHEIVAAGLNQAVMFVTADEPETYFDRLQNLASFGFYIKPFEKKSLLVEIELTWHKHRNVQQNAANLRNMNNLMHALVKALELRDPYTVGHQKNVEKISVAVGKELGLDKSQLQGLRIGALLHDIGKIKIPTQILTKPSRLSGGEFALIREHSTDGYELLKPHLRTGVRTFFYIYVGFKKLLLVKNQ